MFRYFQVCSEKKWTSREKHAFQSNETKVHLLNVMRLRKEWVSSHFNY